MNTQITQTELFSAARVNRDAGIKKAVNNAWEVWALRAYGHLLDYLYRLENYQTFQIEDVRKFAYERGLPKPPTDRVWGFIGLKAAKNGLITKIGIAPTEGATAHQANAGLWRKN